MEAGTFIQLHADATIHFDARFNISQGNPPPCTALAGDQNVEMDTRNDKNP